jgi:hypothetical protein
MKDVPMIAPRVYACFDAAGSKNPAATDLKYYFLLRAWSHRAPLARAFVDVHGIVRSGKPADLRRELIRRMRRSDVLLLILSERTPASHGLLSWEIETATDHCQLPIICTYTGGADVDTVQPAWWPEALRRAITRGRPRTVHIPFQPGALAHAFRTVSTPAPESLPATRRLATVTTVAPSQARTRPCSSA